MSNVGCVVAEAVGLVFSVLAVVKAPFVFEKSSRSSHRTIKGSKT